MTYGASWGMPSQQAKLRPLLRRDWPFFMPQTWPDYAANMPKTFVSQDRRSKLSWIGHMKKLAYFFAAIGCLIVTITAMLAIDTYMTDARKTAVRGDINAALDEGANLFEDERASGCIRHCAGGTSHLLVSLRDGLFLSRPFDPNAALPAAPDGWTRAPYSLAAAETIMGREIRRTALSSPTDNELLQDIDRIATKGSYSAAQIYRHGTSQIAMGIAIDRDAIRKAKDGEIIQDDETANVFTSLTGIPVRLHKQTSYDWRTSEYTPVAYQHLTMDLDGQVTVLILALVEDHDDILTLLSAFDVSAIVETLPHIPQSYDAAGSLAAALHTGGNE